MREKLQITAWWTALEMYAAGLTLLNSNAFVVLGGDLNARLGPKDHTVYA